jgi:hypothetical protein
VNVTQLRGFISELDSISKNERKLARSREKKGLPPLPPRCTTLYVPKLDNEEEFNHFRNEVRTCDHTNRDFGFAWICRWCGGFVIRAEQEIGAIEEVRP